MGFRELFGRKTTYDAHRKSLTFALEGAGVTYEDGRRGLEPATLTITEKRVAVIGLNGAGKTTLLKLLDGALQPTAGAVRITRHILDEGHNPIDGEDVTLDPASKSDAKTLKDLIGIVRREEIPERYYRAENIAEAVAEPLKKSRMPDGARHETIGALFAHFGLTPYAHSKADSLDSEKRHVLAIVGALALNPAAIVADEPTKGLDENATRTVAKALFGYDRQVVFATHDLSIVTDPLYAIDRVIVLDDQRIAFDGRPDQAVERYNALIAEKVAKLSKK